jgi:drug/metabolite transporter (DMT)-like permease
LSVLYRWPRLAPVNIRTAALTFLALIAFASNSLLTRLALGSHQIDATSFTSIRLLSGAVALALIVQAREGTLRSLRGHGPIGATALFVYAVPFSFAYLRIGAAVGALVLFGVVQLTMIGYGISRGERPPVLAWVGLLLASAGLAILTTPAVARPDWLGLGLMALAGVAWAVYSLAGRKTLNPVAANAQSFIWSSVPSLILAATLGHPVTASGQGIALAFVSGAVTSGLGYAIWYRALPRLSVTQAAVSQLSVPVIAAIGAVVLLHETLSTRLMISGVAVLSGVGIVLAARAGKR